MSTPTPLHPALSDAEAFCAILELASRYKLTQDGGAFRSQPKF